MNQARVSALLNFIIERHNIYLTRSRGEPKPWTNNPILQRYRFCNVYRELDTVTQWIAKNWRDRHQKDPDLWFAMAVARLVNWPDTLNELGYPIPWRPQHFINVMAKRAARGEQLYSGAYMISTHGVKMNKAEYLANCALTPMWKDRKRIRPTPQMEFQRFHERLMECRDLGSFMSGQIIADLKYARPYKLAPDWMTFAASGPGSRRGLNRVVGRPVIYPWNESEWKKNLDDLHREIICKMESLESVCDWPVLHAQDLQNCLCEFDKYERVRLGEGRPKSLYPGV